MSRLRLSLFAAFAVVLPAVIDRGPTVRGQTWTGAVNTDWNTAGNWSPAAVPNSGTAVVNFTGNAVGTVNISANVSAQTLSFGNPTGSYILTSSAGVTLGSVQAINVAAGITGMESINLASVPTGNLQTAPSGLTFANDTNSSSTGLLVGLFTVVSGSGPLTFSGVGNTGVSGTLKSSGGLTKTGSGILTLSGDDSGLGGGTTLNGGTLVLDYGNVTNFKLAAGTTNLSGGDLILKTNASTSFTEMAGFGSNVNLGRTTISFNTIGGTGFAVTLALGAITRNAGGALDVSPFANGLVSTTSNTVNGILGGYMTVNGGASWATKSGNNIVPLTIYAVNSYSAGNNTDVTTGSGIPPSWVTNSLRFDTTNLTATLSGLNMIQSGGILLTPNNGTIVVTGGTLTTSGGDLIVHNYMLGGSPTIASQISGSQGLTVSGDPSRFLTLTNASNNYSGGTTILSGALIIDNFAELGSGNITLAGNAFANTLEAQAELEYTGPTAATSKNITLGVNGGAIFVASSGTSLTLNGTISETPGGSRGMVFYGGVVTLTGTNTYTGTTEISSGGVVSIATIANGGTASPIGAASNSPANLILYGGTLRYTGPTAATDRGVSLVYGVLPGTVDVNTAGTTLTMSGQITGTGTFIKAGPGVLVLSNAANNYTGGTAVNAGTLQLGASNALPAGAVTVGSATLDLNGFNQTVAGLTYTTGAMSPTVSTGAGTLTLNGDFAFGGGSGSSAGFLNGNVNLNGAMRTFTFGGITGSTYDLVVNAVLSGAGASGIQMASSSAPTMVLNNANTYAGATTIMRGNLYTGVANSLPATTALTLSNGSGLSLDPFVSALGVTAGSYNQSIASLAGPAGSFINLGTAALTINQAVNTTFSGMIQGSGALFKNGAGTLQLGAANVLNGPMAVTVGGGVLDLNGFNQSIGSLAGPGGATVNLGGATLTVGSNNTDTFYGGGITPAGGTLVKVGTGTLT